jgi:hypothetical protein
MIPDAPLLVMLQCSEDTIGTDENCPGCSEKDQ